jgi:acyl carrier protein
LLWFIKVPGGRRFFKKKIDAAIEDKVIDVICQFLGVTREQVMKETTFLGLGYDSLDIVELVMEFEEEFDIILPDDEADRIRSVRALIEYILRRPDLIDRILHRRKE